MNALALSPQQGRGRPLNLLVIVLFGWVALRAALWQPLDAFDALGAAPPALRPEIPAPSSPLASAYWLALPTTLVASRVNAAGKPAIRLRLPDPTPLPSRTEGTRSSNAVIRLRLADLGPAAIAVEGQRAPYRQTSAAAQSWPTPVIPAATPAGRLAGALALANSRGARLSADGWVLWRPENSDAPISLPAYGRSQAGAVLRYRLAKRNGHRPEGYLRATSALTGVAERELAMGISARPAATVPVRLAAEMRATEALGGTELRPAAYAVTELPPLYLPLATRAEAYLQAGYVGGRYSTSFVDGQARIERRWVRFGSAELLAGGLLAGGAQRGSARLDIGPAAALTLDLGRVRARAGAEYRFRVVGNARPSSGPALTLSAGF